MKKANVFISLCLVLVISSVIAYLYVGPKGSGASDDLTERVENLESRLDEQLVLSDGVLRMESGIITFAVTHIGTAFPVNISEIRVNNVLNGSSPGWEGATVLAPGTVGEITLYGLKYFAEGFTSENCYPITVTTTRGNTFYLYGLMFTFMQNLCITGVTFQTGNSTISVQNTGTVTLSISSVTVNDVQKTVLATGGSITGSGPYDLAKGASGTITISLSWASGIKYTFAVLTDNAWAKDTYTTIAP